MDERQFWLEIRRGLLTQLRAIDKRLGIHSSYTVYRDAPIDGQAREANATAQIERPRSA